MNADHKFTIRQHLKQADKLRQVAGWHFDKSATLALDAEVPLDDLIDIAVDELHCQCFETIELGLRQEFEAIQELRKEESGTE